MTAKAGSNYQRILNSNVKYLMLMKFLTISCIKTGSSIGAWNSYNKNVDLSVRMAGSRDPEDNAKEFITFWYCLYQLCQKYLCRWTQMLIDKRDETSELSLLKLFYQLYNIC